MSQRFSGKTILMVLGASLLAACSTGPVKPVRDASVMVADDRALVAFSVAHSDGLRLRKLEWVLPQASGWTKAVDLTVEPGELYLFSVPSGTGRFGRIRLLVEDAWWESGEPGPEFAPQAGVLTYLGRIAIGAVRLGAPSDTGKRLLRAVLMGAEDASDEDLARLVRERSLPPDYPVVTALPGAWSESGFVAMHYRPIPGRDHRYENLDDWGFGSGPVGPELPTGGSSRR